mmetsp:Transcript_13135/g.34909  ORF Transcript_13135/g.34909 Transcript_13135/m.34909 type:complete len:96 (-) Transcript_13135:233-520(-)
MASISSYLSPSSRFFTVPPPPFIPTLRIDYFSHHLILLPLHFPFIFSKMLCTPLVPTPSIGGCKAGCGYSVKLHASIVLAFGARRRRFELFQSGE